jgi:hypothetical protein
MRSRIALALLLALATSCGREGEPSGRLLQASSPAIQQINPPRFIDEASNPPPRSTPTELLTAYFEQAYARRDSVLYAAMLDRRFEFVFLPVDADSLGTETWSKRMDLQSTGSMFRDSRVVSITLNIRLDADLPYVDEECDNCRQMETTVALSVVVDLGGGEQLVLAVDSPQTFLVRPDPIQTGKWVVFRQVDRAPLLARGGLWASAETFDVPSCNVSWGCLKACGGDGPCTVRGCCGKQGG